MYHRIDVLKPSLPPMTRRLTVDPNVFRMQMTWLVRNGYHSAHRRSYGRRSTAGESCRASRS
jgi:hypothetical protein